MHNDGDAADRLAHAIRDVIDEAVRVALQSLPQPGRPLPLSYRSIHLRVCRDCFTASPKPKSYLASAIQRCMQRTRLKLKVARPMVKSRIIWIRSKYDKFLAPVGSPV